MRTVEHVVTHLIVHALVREPGTPSRLVLREAPCALDAAALRLAERLCAQYESRSAKGFGRFEEDEESYPLARWLRACQSHTPVSAPSRANCQRRSLADNSATSALSSSATTISVAI